MYPISGPQTAALRETLSTACFVATLAGSDALRLAATHGIQCRVVLTTEKVGGTYIITTYPAPGIPGSIATAEIPGTAHRPDFYRVSVEVADARRGASVQVEAEHDTPADPRNNADARATTLSRAFRDGVLALVPHDVLDRFLASRLTPPGSSAPQAERQPAPQERPAGLAERRAARAAPQHETPAATRPNPPNPPVPEQIHAEPQQNIQPAAPPVSSRAARGMGAPLPADAFANVE